MKSIVGISFILATLPGFADTTVPALAENPTVATAASGWKVRSALYGWRTMLEGDVMLRGIEAPVDVGFSDMLAHLGYRGIGTDYDDGDFGYGVISHGVLIGIEHQF